MTNLGPVPAHLRNRVAKGTSHAAMAGSVSGPPRISLKDDGFTFIDAAGEERSHDLKYLDVVIVDVNPNKSKAYYASAYTPGSDNKGPTCFSIDGIVPSEQSDKKQCSTCGECQLGQFGSKINEDGKKSSHCRPNKRIAVVVPELDNEMVFLLVVPTTSITPLANYAKTLMGTSMGHRPTELGDVVTRLRLKSKVLQFDAQSFINDRVALLCDKLDHTDKTGILVGRIADPSGVDQLTYQPPRIQHAPVPVPVRAPPKEIAAPVGFGRTYTPTSATASDKVDGQTYYYDSRNDVKVGVPDFIGDKVKPVDEIPEFPTPKTVAPVSSFGMVAAPSMPGELTDELTAAFNFQVGDE